MPTEVLNALWKKLKRHEVEPVQGTIVSKVLERYFDLLMPSAELSPDSFQLALDCDHPVYDCFYVALAGQKSASLATFDQRLKDIAQKAKVELYRL